MILAYAIVTVLAVIVGSVAGHTFEIIKEISKERKGNESLKESNHMKNIKLGE